ncbi:MAG TPA: protein kinase, partial [Gemmataceae bacterium]|nr:protein kinase [Gemmataceae bacterium]
MTGCPSRKLLERLLQEQLGEAELPSVEEHVETCSHCQDVLDRLARAEDSESGSVSGARREPPADTEDAFLRQLKRTPPSSTASGELHSSDRAHPATPAGPWPTLPGYEILGELGQGGMGVVYKARQIGLHRLVALKMLRAAAQVTPRDLARLRREAEAVAQLQHPNIVQIYDIGESEGRPYFGLEFVEGGSLAAKIRGDLQPFDVAARLVETLARAIHFAHQQGIIHRDLKPSNVLLAVSARQSAVEGKPGNPFPARTTPHWSQITVPKITDFGLAKWLDGSDAWTQTGEVVGTPSYMAPEQAVPRPPGSGAGSERPVGPAADIYALGATLYELLTGRPPFKADTMIDTVLQVLHDEPVTPERLRPKLPRDLETICLKCLEKEPHRRYASALALADDLQRFLADEPIQARRQTQLERFVRWARHHPGIAVLGGVLTAVLVLVTVASLLAAGYFNRLRLNEAQAAQSERDARREAEEAADEAHRRGDAERWERYRSNIAAAAGALQLQNSGTARSALDAAPPEHRNWEWQYFHNQLDGASLVLPVQGGKVIALVLSPSGQQIAVCCADHNHVYLYDVATGKLDAVLRGHTAPATSVAYSPDGKQIATASNDQTIRLWDPATGQQTALLRAGSVSDDRQNQEHYPLVAYNRDGSRIASYALTNGGAGTSRLWDADTGTEIAVLGKWQEIVPPVAFSPDGKRVAAGAGQFVHLCDAVTGRQLAALGPHARPVWHLAYSPDGKRIACATAEGNAIHLWDGESGKEVAVLAVPCVAHVLFSPDGSRLVSWGAHPDNTVRLWDAATGRLLAVLAGHKNSINAVAFSPDGKRVATASFDQTGRLWDGRTGQLLAVLRGHTGRVWHVLFSPNGTRVVTASDDTTLRLWDAQAGELFGVLRGHGDHFLYCAPVFTLDGSRLVSGSDDGTVRIWDMSLVERNGILSGHKSYVYDVAFSPGGEQVAAAAWDGTARLWDATTGLQSGLFKHETEILTSVAFSRDGRRLATVERERGVTLWDVSSQKAAHDWRVPLAGYDPRASLNPAGTLLAAVSAEGPVRLWDVVTGREVARLEGHDKDSIDVAFDPDGSLLATTGIDGTVRLWDVATRTPVAVLRGHTDFVWRVAFSADGKLLASCSHDKTICLWDAQTHERLAVIPLGRIV